ncbi:MAG: hypothetical protein WA478_08585 [Pseudolabrys sp.]
MGKPTLAELQTKLDGVRREVRNLTVMEMDPKQPPDQVALIRDLEQSAQVEMRLRSMARVNRVPIVNRETRMQRAINPRVRNPMMTLHR